MRFSQQRFADQADRNSGGGGFDRRAQTGPTRPNYEDIVFVNPPFPH
jgi:hypothetical protein